MDMKTLRRIRIRRKLRQVFRQVMNNRYWLIDLSDRKIGNDVRGNVALIYRTRKDSGGLTLEDKAIMRKKIELRTDDEKMILFSSIGGMKCFRQWPENVKFQLVSCTSFVYYEPGRTIVKQNRHAEALYFLVTGEIEILQTYYDEVIQEWVTTCTGKLLPGENFGEISLLKNLPLTFTLRTLTHCELLRVDKDNFNETLRDTLKELWDEIKEGLSRFPYFSGLSEIAQTECCTLSKLREFEPNEIIYSSEAKKFGMAYFIFEGSCRIIEKMYIREKKDGNKIVYSVYTPSKELRLMRPLQPSAINRLVKSSTIFKQKSKTSVTMDKYFLNARQETIKQEIYSKCPHIIGLLHNFGLHEEEIQEELFETESQSSKNLPGDVKCHFLEVCTLKKSACFFENEIFDNRYLISNTKMKILCVPIYWLYQNNRANIWNRLILFMKCIIPSSENVFKKFVDDRKWLTYKRTCTKQILGKKADFVTTLWSDVPYSLRIDEVYQKID